MVPVCAWHALPLRRKRHRQSRADCGGIASGRFARAAVGAQRRANEDAQALQTMARCGGLPRESLVAFATVILDNLLRQLAPTQDTPGCVLGGLSNVDDHPG